MTWDDFLRQLPHMTKCARLPGHCRQHEECQVTPSKHQSPLKHVLTASTSKKSVAKPPPPSPARAHRKIHETKHPPWLGLRVLRPNPGTEGGNGGGACMHRDDTPLSDSQVQCGSSCSQWRWVSRIASSPAFVAPAVRADRHPKSTFSARPKSWSRSKATCERRPECSATYEAYGADAAGF